MKVEQMKKMVSGFISKTQAYKDRESNRETRYKLLRRGMILQAGCNGNDVIAIWHEHQISDMKGTFLPKIWEK